MRSPSTATANTVPFALQMPGICCLSACRRRSGQRKWLTRCCRHIFIQAGDCGRWLKTRSPFNPMAYHNGSVWPHDTAICATGLARYGDRDNVIKLLSETFEAAVSFNMRLPELFCGFTRQLGEAPVAYPVACLPQAWSAGAVFMLMQACLGLKIDAWRSAVEVTNPRLPIGIDNLFLRHISVGDRRVDVGFRACRRARRLFPGQEAATRTRTGRAQLIQNTETIGTTGDRGRYFKCQAALVGFDAAKGVTGK